MIIEPVQGLAGAFDFATEFLHAIRAACDRAGALLIIDEVQTGMGRLGAPFGAQLHGVRPDLLTMAKGLGGGFPCGAVLMPQSHRARPEARRARHDVRRRPRRLRRDQDRASTSSTRDKLLANVREVSAAIRATCSVGPVESIQGRGFLLGLQTRAEGRRRSRRAARARHS